MRRRRLLLLLLLFLVIIIMIIIKSPLYFSARNSGGGSGNGNGNGNGWFVDEGEGTRNFIFRYIFIFLFFISCCGDDCFCCFCFCCWGIVVLLSRTMEETNLGEGGKGGKGRRRGGVVIVGGVRNRGGFGFGEIGIWAFRELWNFLGGGVFIIVVLEVALPVENMCELEIFFFRFFFIFGRSG